MFCENASICSGLALLTPSTEDMVFKAPGVSIIAPGLIVLTLIFLSASSLAKARDIAIAAPFAAIMADIAGIVLFTAIVFVIMIEGYLPLTRSMEGAPHDNDLAPAKNRRSRSD